MAVRDEYGNVIPDLQKTTDGVLVAEAGLSYNKYLQEKQRVEQIKTLTQDVDELKEMVHRILALVSKDK